MSAGPQGRRGRAVGGCVGGAAPWEGTGEAAAGLGRAPALSVRARPPHEEKNSACGRLSAPAGPQQRQMAPACVAVEHPRPYAVSSQTFPR